MLALYIRYNMNEDTTQEMLTVEETAKLLRLHPITIREYCSSGFLPSYQIAGKNGRILLKRSEIDNFLRQARKTEW